MLIQISTSIFLALLVYSIFSFKTFIEKFLSKKLAMDKYVELLGVVEQSKAIAYKTVWQENLIVELGNGYKISDEEFARIKNKYVKFVLELCGPSVVDMLISIHGSLESLCLLLVMGLSAKIAEDEAKFLTGVEQGDPDEIRNHVSTKEHPGGL